VDMTVFYNFIYRQLLKKVPKTEFLLYSFIAFFISVLSFEIELEMEPINGKIILWNNRGILLTRSLYMFIVLVMIFPVQIAGINFYDSCR